MPVNQDSIRHSPIQAQLCQWLRDDRDAVEFCLAVFRFCHLWDDLIDQDTEVTHDTIHRAMAGALIDLPKNRFYRLHHDALWPILQMGVVNWKSANRLEKSSIYEHRVMAFTLRSIIMDIVAMCALLIGGEQWAELVHYDMQIANKELLREYLDTLKEDPNGVLGT